jgi:hypothetical protein
MRFITRLRIAASAELRIRSEATTNPLDVGCGQRDTLDPSHRIRTILSKQQVQQTQPLEQNISPHVMAMKGKRRRFVLGSAPCCGISENGSICDKAVCSNHVRSCPENDRIADTPQKFQSTV